MKIDKYTFAFSSSCFLLSESYLYNDDYFATSLNIHCHVRVFGVRANVRNTAERIQRSDLDEIGAVRYYFL